MAACEWDSPGGIASGKSTVSAILAELGATVIDADQLAREMVAKGTPGLAQVVEAFGSQILTADGEMDRALVGRIVFDDEAKRKVLEGSCTRWSSRVREARGRRPGRRDRGARHPLLARSPAGLTRSTRSSWSNADPRCRS